MYVKIVPSTDLAEEIADIYECHRVRYNVCYPPVTEEPYIVLKMDTKEGVVEVKVENRYEPVVYIMNDQGATIDKVSIG